MNEPYHIEIEKWARQKRGSFRDVLDDKNHPTARLIEHNIQKLEDEAQSGHSLRALHDRMESIERDVHQAQYSSQPFMSIDHSLAMHKNFEHKRMDIRKHPHFN
jgi:hypothetical protein